MTESTDDPSVEAGAECRWVVGRCSDYIDVELGGEECLRIERHVLDCPECGRLIGDLIANVRELASWRDQGHIRAADDPDPLCRRIIERIRLDG